MHIGYHITILLMAITSWSVDGNQGRNNSTRILSRKLRNIVFPPGASQGIFLALSIPIEIPEKGGSLSLSYNYEANYPLPFNATQFTDPHTEPPSASNAAPVSTRRRRSLDRRRAYVILEKKMKSKGMDGRSCLLRAICEAAETPLSHNGLAGDLMHILFTPSASMNKKLDVSFIDAETRGTAGEDCRELYPGCPVGLFDFISTLDH